MATVRGEVVAMTVVEVVAVAMTVATGIERKLEQNGVALASFSASTISSTSEHSISWIIED